MPQLSPHNALTCFLIMWIFVMCMSITLSLGGPKVMTHLLVGSVKPLTPTYQKSTRLLFT
uniref:ATP Synthetase Subunit 8 n=1 Tax=Cerion watlingense TaxID=1108941 RepID=A0A8K2ARC2_9EUPU|nr:ATP Synthetase Subunit 8 [Cerion watlingense]UEQ12606.1 ATP Synthetase Subunit 8 [Cerion watlingense]